MVLYLYRNFNRMKNNKGGYIMNIDILLKLIDEDDDLKKFEKVFISHLTKMTHSWKEVNDDILFMPISEKTEIKIRKILCNIGDEMIQICDLLIKENNK